MAAAIAILRDELARALRDRDCHLARGRLGNVEAAIAGHKVAWLKALIGRIERLPN